MANVQQEERLLTQALETRGITSQRVDWQTPQNWAAFDAAVLRSPWNYQEHLPEYRRFLADCARQTRLLNPLPLVEWNLDKVYLLELQRAGVPIVPTVVYDLERDPDLPELASFLGALGWSEFVVKPTISASGRETHRVRWPAPPDTLEHLRRLADDEALLVQPFQSAIIEQGEYSLVMIGGEYSHALCKRARPGEFRVQDDHGGTLHDFEPSPRDLEFARAALEACPHAPAYGRVDFVRGRDAQPALMELELIEPELWFRRKPSSAEQFADAVLSQLQT